MFEELKETIINRVIGELFIEAEKLIKESIKLTEKNSKLITIGLSLSISGLFHALLSPAAAISLDVLNAFITTGIVTGRELEYSRIYADKIQNFLALFDIKNEDIYKILKKELASDLRVSTYFTQNQLDAILDKGILNLSEKEIELFSKIRFNDNQVKYLEKVIAKKEKINVINFLDLAMLDASEENKKFIQLGGKNKTLQEIVNPKKTLKISL